MNRVISQGIDFLWDVDLADVSVLSEENDNIKFLLVAIDVFSRQARVEPLKNKLHGSIIDALNNIFKTGRKPEELRTHKSSEFKNRWVKIFSGGKQLIITSHRTSLMLIMPNNLYGLSKS